MYGRNLKHKTLRTFSFQNGAPYFGSFKGMYLINNNMVSIKEFWANQLSRCSSWLHDGIHLEKGARFVLKCTVLLKRESSLGQFQVIFLSFHSPRFVILSQWKNSHFEVLIFMIFSSTKLEDFTCFFFPKRAFWDRPFFFLPLDGIFINWRTPQENPHPFSSTSNAEKHQDAAKTVEVDLDIVACRCILMDKISGKPLDVVNIVLIAVFEISQVLRRNLIYFLHPSRAIKRYV